MPIRLIGKLEYDTARAAFGEEAANLIRVVAEQRLRYPQSGLFGHFELHGFQTRFFPGIDVVDPECRRRQVIAQ